MQFHVQCICVLYLVLHKMQTSLTHSLTHARAIAVFCKLLPNNLDGWLGPESL